MMRLSSVIILVLSILWASTASAENEKRNVLYLNSYQNGYKWSDDILDGLRNTFP